MSSSPQDEKDEMRQDTDQLLEHSTAVPLTNVGTNGQSTRDAKEREAMLGGGGEKPPLLPAPMDKLKIVYLIMLLNGVGTLMPWNMFINANQYFSEKLNVTTSAGVKGEPYADYYLNLLGIIAQVPNLLLSAFNMFYQKSGETKMTRRMVIAVMTMVLSFVATVVFAMIDTAEWPHIFFFVTMAIVVVLNMASGIYQNNVYGMAACLPMKYTNAVVIGSNGSGTIVAVIAILTTLSAPSMRIMAIYYFVAAILILLVAFDLFFVLPLLRFYRHYKTAAKSQKALSVQQGGSSRPPYLFVFKKCWIHHMSVWFVFFVSLATFPAINAGIQPQRGFPVQRPMYVLIFCFLFFNCFALMGNICASFFQKPGPRWVWIPVVLRVVFIPFFLLCNYRPEARTLPVLFEHDAWAIAGMIVFAWSSGYLSSLCMMYAPGNVEAEHMGTAGMMAAFFLIFGIFSGVCASFGLAALAII